MAKYLRIAGIITFIIPTITGFVAGGFWTGVIATVSAAVSALLFFGVAHICDELEEIRTDIFNFKQQSLTIASKGANNQCNNCGKTFDISYHNCPYCGREQ